LLLILFALSPSPSNQQKSQPTEQNPATQQTPSPSSPVTVVVNQPSPSERQDSTAAKTKNGPPIYSNWALVIVALLAACAGLRSLHFIKQQAIQTEKAANAARDNASAVINSERAWVMVNIRPQQNATWHMDIMKPGPVEYVGLYLSVICKNEGKTLAWITEKWADVRVINVFPPAPDFSDPLPIFQHAVQPIASGEEDVGTPINFEVLNSHIARKPMLLYGYVKYRTIFENRDGETRFGYIVTPMNSIERLPADFPAYNRNT
jgi:hypothetical protein